MSDMPTLYKTCVECRRACPIVWFEDHGEHNRRSFVCKDCRDPNPLSQEWKDAARTAAHLYYQISEIREGLKRFKE